MFLCTVCGRAYEPREGGLAPFWPLQAAPTTELAVAGGVRHLAVWRVTATVTCSLSARGTGAPESAWERIVRTVAPQPAYLYVPGFSLLRPVVQMLGVSLTRTQPELELSQGLRGETREDVMAGPATVRLVGKEDDKAAQTVEGPALDLFSPVVVGREDARALSHFVYLALESHEARELRRVDYELEVTAEELLFIPAVWDPRYIHEANWRLLLREFDGLVA